MTGFRHLERFLSVLPRPIHYLKRRIERQRRVRELRRAVFLGKYRIKPDHIAQGLEKKGVLDDLNG